ncbi:uncharacterized protein [Dasypus novemcinctus]|uniref:uncharacterized protein isoform X1 n=1 Tax=Dasypus novemcinctus TaxID=9361 RepID=UPI00265ED7DC|nr:uncharacterized protein LOC101423537 isoform X1 [Dasypus novemcinctus]XP_058136403.1 uncharacterized protein LOC101423537 isoform X1 [Dasypus novemcinctus]
MQCDCGRLRKLLGADNPAKALADIMNCNVLSVAQMTRIVLPQMVARWEPASLSSVWKLHPTSSPTPTPSTPGLFHSPAAPPTRPPLPVGSSSLSLQRLRFVGGVTGSSPAPTCFSCRGRGVIINISSEAENSPCPFLAAYAATKAFVGSFSRAVGAEYLSQGVTVQTVSPLILSTNMTKHLHLGLLLKDPRDSLGRPWTPWASPRTPLGA